jgi:2,3-dimethylmalate lyase
MTASPGARFRAAMREAGTLVVPGVFDGLSAMLAERAGFPALYQSGYATAAGAGLPDLGLWGLSETLERSREISSATTLPVLVDAETGFGGERAVQRMVKLFEQAGVAGIQIEDQAEPRRRAAAGGMEVTSTSDMQRKIEAAVAAKTDPDFIVVGRTDCVASLGFDEAIARAKAYEEAGADMILVVSPRDEAELDALPGAVSVPVAKVMSRGNPQPTLDVARLATAGYALAIVSTTVLLAATAAMTDALEQLRTTSDLSAITTPQTPNSEFNVLIGLVKAPS